MNPMQTSHEKRTIKVKDFLDDFYGGMSEAALLKTYNLTPTGLEKFFSMLLDRGILDSQELQDHYRRENLRQTGTQHTDIEKASYICPACLAAHDTMFDICPRCGVSFHELMSRERQPEVTSPEESLFASLGPEKGAEQGEKILEVSGDARATDRFEPVPSQPANEWDAAPAKEVDNGYFARAEEPLENHSGFDDPMDEIVHGRPLEHVDDADTDEAGAQVICETCQESMQSGLRDIYDRGRGYLAIKMSATFFILGILGCLMVSFFDGYSLGRLIVVCFTGISFLAGASLLTVGAFMLLARERIYFCPVCKRIYPRG
jgi:hypothetical protein